MKVTIRKDGRKRYVADRPGLSGSPTVGRGSTPLEALGALFWHIPLVEVDEETVKLMRKKHPDHCWETAR